MSKESKNTKIAIIAIFVLVLLIKLIISFQTTTLNQESYFHLQQAKDILTTGSPTMQNYFYDNAAIPLVDYILSFFGLFMNLQIAAKIIISVVLSSIVILVYHITLEITRDKKAAILAAFFSGFIPIIFKSLTNNFSSSGVSIFMYLLTLLYFTKSMNNQEFIRHFIISLIILVLISPLSLIFIATFVVYFIMLSAEKMKIYMSEIETFIFSLILGGWIYVIIYKKAIMEKGFLFFLHPVVTNTKEVIGIQSLSLIGIIPIILGIIGIYYIITKKPNRRVIFVLSFIITSIIFLILNLTEQNFTLSLIGLGLTICSAITLKEFRSFFDKSRVQKLYLIILYLIVLIFIITSVIPSVTNSLIETHNSPTQNDVNALLWAKENTEKDSTIISSVDEIYTVSYFSERKNILDSDNSNINFRNKIKDNNRFFSLTLSTEATRILTLYEVDYIFLSEKSIPNLKPAIELNFEGDCFSEVYNDGSKIYKRLCTIKKENEINKEIFDESDETKV